MQLMDTPASEGLHRCLRQITHLASDLRRELGEVPIPFAVADRIVSLLDGIDRESCVAASFAPPKGNT
jgi:hypothetical protein